MMIGVLLGCLPLASSWCHAQVPARAPVQPGVQLRVRVDGAPGAHVGELIRLTTDSLILADAQATRIALARRGLLDVAIATPLPRMERWGIPAVALISGTLVGWAMGELAQIGHGLSELGTGWECLPFGCPEGSQPRRRRPEPRLAPYVITGAAIGGATALLVYAQSRQPAWRYIALDDAFTVGMQVTPVGIKARLTRAARR
ncbi:MAG: hypothetical protein MUE41_02280 [Gemmatimonadaceae bacterium]|nr:hypothetical protein [Gemmatimonadaceae bacterium]